MNEWMEYSLLHITFQWQHRTVKLSLLEGIYRRPYCFVAFFSRQPYDKRVGDAEGNINKLADARDFICVKFLHAVNIKHY